LNIAYEIADQLNQEEKWKVVGDTALAKWQVLFSFNLILV
jgi:hypothetical protein